MQSVKRASDGKWSFGLTPFGLKSFGSIQLYNVVNSIITDRKMYRCIFKVSFYFRGSLYEINVSLKLFLQIEVSI